MNFILFSSKILQYKQDEIRPVITSTFQFFRHGQKWAEEFFFFPIFLKADYLP